MNKKRDIWSDRHKAMKRLRRAAEIGNCSTSDLLRAKARRPVINALTSNYFTQEQLGMRQRSMGDRWAELVELSADKTWALGFVEIDRGIRGLGEDLQTPFTSLSRNLVAWREANPPLVRIATHTPEGDQERFVMLQVPLVTRWLLWVAEYRAQYFAQVPRALYLDEISEIAQVMICSGMEPSVMSYDDARKVLKNLRRVSVNL
jgi:hypothetical protein